jgi:hypothetical protein
VLPEIVAASKPVIVPALVPMLPSIVELEVLLKAPTAVKMVKSLADPREGKHCECKEINGIKNVTITIQSNFLEITFFI